MKVSNCCGENGNVSHHISFIVDDWITYEQQELCPKCGEHCEYIDETDLNTINTDDKPKETDTTCTVPSAK